MLPKKAKLEAGSKDSALLVKYHQLIWIKTWLLMQNLQELGGSR